MKTGELTEEQLALYKELTTMQKGVAMMRINNPQMSDVGCYIKGGGGAKSYASQRSSAHIIFTNGNVVRFLNSVRHEHNNPLVMGREEMLERLSIMARTEIGDVVDTYTGRQLMDMENGEEINGQTMWSLKPVNEMGEGGMLSVSELVATKDGYKIKMHDQKAAMKLLADMQGFNAPVKQEISGPNGGPVEIANISDEELAERLLGMGLDVD